MNISENGLAFIRAFEGFSPEAYQDSVGIWTIGYGWTHPIDGIPIHDGMMITSNKAERLLRSGIKKYEQDINRYVKVPLTQNQFDALVSFAYNLGSQALNQSTLLKLLNAGNTQGAAEEFLRWNKAGGRILPGLIRRRKAERELFLS